MEKRADNHSELLEKTMLTQSTDPMLEETGTKQM